MPGGAKSERSGAMPYVAKCRECGAELKADDAEGLRELLVLHRAEWYHLARRGGRPSATCETFKVQRVEEGQSIGDVFHLEVHCGQLVHPWTLVPWQPTEIEKQL